MLIIGGKIVTWDNPNQILYGYGLRIQDGKIIEILDEQELIAQYPQDERIDARGQFVLPGNICAHTHFYGAFSRGMAIPGKAPDAFPQILEKLWWPLDRSLSLKDVHYSALVCLVDAIKHGTTTLLDHHASPNAIDGSLDEIATAVQTAGVRASLCYEVTDRNGLEGAKSGIIENLRFLESIKTSGNGYLSGSFGLHASLTLSEETMKECRKACPEEIGFHIHVAEHPADEYDSIEKCGERVIDRLWRHQMLGPRTIVVHAVHVDPKEIEILAREKSWVTHQPRSNMNNAVGLPDVEGMMRSGIKVCLGNDGFSNAMWEEWKAAYLSHKLVRQDPRRLSGYSVVDMAIYHNAELAQVQLNCAPIGVLKPGAEADLIFVDYHPFTPMTPENIPWHILFGFHESMVTTTIVGGKLLMRDRELLTLDEEKICAEADRLSRQVWHRYERLFS